jgi:hypothetical protein
MHILKTVYDRLWKTADITVYVYVSCIDRHIHYPEISFFFPIACQVYIMTIA